MRFVLVLGKLIGVEVIGFAARNRQRFPVIIEDHFADKDDLPDMIRIMRKLPVDGFHYSMTLVTDVDDFAEIVIGQRTQSVKEAIPALIPQLHHEISGLNVVVKFGIAMAPRFLAVGSQKVSPS